MTTSLSTTLNHVVLFADHGIADTEFSKKHKAYTAAMAVDGSEGLLPFQEPSDVLQQVLIDIGVDRYWAELRLVEDRKISRGTHNFLLRPSLEPQRLEKAVRLGHHLMIQSPESPMYISAISAGNDLSAECLIKSLYDLSGLVTSANQPIEFAASLSKLNFEGTHPFDFLERFGGYEIAAIVGVILTAQQKGTKVFLDGWSAIGALAIAYKLNEGVLSNCVVVYSPNNEICAQFLSKLEIAPLFTEEPPYEGGFFVERVLAT